MRFAIVTVRHRGFCAYQDRRHQTCCERVFRCSDEDVVIGGESTPRAGYEHVVHTVAGNRASTVFTIADTCSIDVAWEDEA